MELFKYITSNQRKGCERNLSGKLVTSVRLILLEAWMKVKRLHD